MEDSYTHYDTYEEMAIAAQIGIVEACLTEHASNTNKLATEDLTKAVEAAIEQLERGSSRAWAIYIGLTILDGKE